MKKLLFLMLCMVCASMNGQIPIDHVVVQSDDPSVQPNQSHAPNWTLNSPLNAVLNYYETNYYQVAYPNARFEQTLNSFKVVINDASKFDALATSLDSLGIFNEVLPILIHYETASCDDCTTGVQVNDPNIDNLPDLINLPCAWEVTTGSPSITVAAVDQFFDHSHDDHNGKILDIRGTCNQNLVTCNHGYMIVGAIAAIPDNNICTAGSGYNTSVIGYCAGSNFCGFGSPGGPAWQAYLDGETIVNISYRESALSIARVKEMTDSGVTIIYPADGDNNINTRNIPGVIHVGRVKQNFDYWPYHGDNPDVDIFVPIENVHRTIALNGCQVSGGGNSHSAPIIAGIVALMKDVNPCLSPADFENILKQSHQGLPNNPTQFNGIVNGIVDAYAAVCLAETYTGDLVVDQDETWEAKMVSGDVYVENNSTLTVKGEVTLGETSMIYVEKGSTLIVDGGILTSCSTRWEGVKVEGKYSHNGTPGTVILRNGAIIENAVDGISDNVGHHLGGMIVLSDGGEFRNNIRDVEFLRTRDVNQSIFFNNTLFTGSDIGVDIDRTSGIDFISCRFENINTFGIVVDDANIFVNSQTTFDNCQTAIKLNKTFPNKRPTEIKQSFFYNCDIDIHSTGASLGSLILEGNIFEGQENSLWMDGDNFFRIQGNDLLGSEVAGLIQSAGSPSNRFNNNYVSGSLIGTFPVYDNVGTKLLDNCYDNTSYADIWIDGTINRAQGTDDHSAGNCFSHLAIDLGATNADEFDYFLEQGNPVSCYDPFSPGNYTIKPANSTFSQNCGTGSSAASNRFYCNLGPFNSTWEILTELKRISVIIRDINNSSYPPEVIESLVAYYAWCQNWLKFYLADEYLEEESVQLAIDLFKDTTEFEFKIRAYGIMVSEEMYSEADSFLLSLTSENTAEYNFIEVQKLNLERLTNDSTFYLTETDSSFIRQAGLETDPLAAYARGLWFELTGEVLYVDLPAVPNFNGSIMNREVQQKDMEFNIFPNPSDGIFNIQIEGIDKDNSLQYHVFDITGRLVSQNMSVKRNNFLDLSSESSGIYFIKILDNDNLVTTKKLMLE